MRKLRHWGACEQDVRTFRAEGPRWQPAGTGLTVLRALVRPLRAFSQTRAVSPWRTASPACIVRPLVCYVGCRGVLVRMRPVSRLVCGAGGNEQGSAEDKGRDLGGRCVGTKKTSWERAVGAQGV